MKLQLWLVQQFVGGFWDVRQQKYTKSEFEFTGVFDSKEKAISACRDSDYLVTPITPNEQLPHESIDIPGAFFPMQSTGGESE